MRAGRVASFWGNAVYICTRMLMYEYAHGMYKNRFCYRDAAFF
jgi:hypothetical protein